MTTPPPTPTRADPSKNLIYVIGDPNGEVVLLDKMFRKIKNNPSHLPFASNDTIVIMGNFIHESGKHSAKMLAAIKDHAEALDGQVVVLRGRTESHLLKNSSKFYAEGRVGRGYINSYKKPLAFVPHAHGYKIADKQKNGLQGISAMNDLRWLADSTRMFYDCKHYFICSSGINTHKKTLDEQNQHSLMFLGQLFWTSSQKFEKMIVHGSKIATNNKVEIRHNRINVNTDCSETGVLSCVVLDDSKGTVQEIITVTA